MKNVSIGITRSLHELNAESSIHRGSLAPCDLLHHPKFKIVKKKSSNDNWEENK